jgi:glycerol-3-phosphate dehydrogenase subunit B
MFDLKTIDCDLAVIGAGMAGMTAALFAAKRGLQVVQIGQPVGFNFASGLLDLMAIHPVAEGKVWEDPWACIEVLARDVPQHPYVKVSKDDMQAALIELDLFLQAAGICYRGKDGLNVDMITAAGTLKKTYKIPQTMWAGVEALENRHPCLLVDFYGLREFSARQIAAVCRSRWPNLRTVRLPFPGNIAGREVITGEMSAWTIAQSENLAALARDIRPHVKEAKAVGVPAILGLGDADRIISNLESQLGVAVFEIPTSPPSVPGMRLLDAFNRRLPLLGVRQLLGHRVREAKLQPTGKFLLEINHGMEDQVVRSRGIILSTGRFLGNGLQADLHGIHETVFNLPVSQPKTRNQWHRKEFFSPQGHAINSAGIEVDQSFRPLDITGRPAFEKLHAAGSILAHQDWMRMKCGTGLATITAYAAVKAFATSCK